MRIEKADHPVAKRIVDVMFILRVSLRCADYLMKEDLKFYRLAPIDEDDVSPPLASSGVNTLRPLGIAAEVAPSVSLAKFMLPIVVPSSSTVVPPWAMTKVAIAASPTTQVSLPAGGFTSTPRGYLTNSLPILCL